MPPFLRERLARLRRASEGTTARTALAFASVTAGVVLAGTAISYGFARDLSREKELSSMAYATAEEAERLAERISGFSVLVAALAADEPVAAAVVDSEGRDRHLAPVLRLLQPTLDRQFSAASSGGRLARASVALLDYRGRFLVGSTPDIRERLPGAELLDAAGRGQAQGWFDEAQKTLYVAHPVIYRATGQPEGIALGILEISTQSLPTRLSLRWREALTPGTGSGAPDPASATVQRPLPLAAPLDQVPLQLSLSIPYASLDAEARAILQPHLAVAIVGVLLSFLIGAGLAQRTTRPLRRLATAARRIDPSLEAASFSSVAAGGAREVLQLGRALDEALVALRESTAAARLAKAALDEATEGVAIVDARQPDLPAIYVNRAYERITGFPETEVLGRNLRFLHARDPAQPALENVRAALRAGTPVQVLLRNWRKDGEAFWNELSIAPVRGGARGEITHFIGIQKDASQRIQAEEHLRASQKLESLGQLTGGLAHDFNNLLGIVIGNLDILAETLPADSPERGRADNALKAALRGADVTRSLLAVARRQHLEPQDTDVNERLREMLPLLANTLGRRVQLTPELDPAPRHALVDVAGLDTAVLNFTINARDAMAEAGGVLRIRTRGLTLPDPAAGPELAELPPGPYLAIEVIDSGCGMPREVRERAFEPFYTTKPVGRGTGLGLSMVYGFARQSGGTALLADAPGGGTVATLVLPALPGPASS